MRRKLFWLGGLLFLVCGIYLLAPILLEGMGRFLIVRDEIRSADVIVVLAGDENGERVEEGVRLYKKGYARKMLMSGGPLAWKLTAAGWMKKQAVHLGVPARAILIEDRSRSTLENGLFTLPILKKIGARSCILVTSPEHSRRAKRVFKNILGGAGIQVISSPVPLEESEFKLPGWWRRHEDTQAVVWEYISFVYYLLRGY